MDIEKANAYAGDYLTKLAVDREMDKFRAERQAQEEEEWKNKSFMDRIEEIGSDAISTAADVGANVASTAASIGKEYISSTWDATVNAVDKLNDLGTGWREMLHQGANLQEAMQNGTFSQENISNLQQSAENYMTDLNRLSDAGEGVLRAPTRPLVRAFVNANAENPDSPYFNTASTLGESEAYIKYYMTDEERLAKSRTMEEKLGIPAEITSVDNKAFSAALQVYNFMQKEQDVDKVWEEFPEIKKIADMDPQAAALALHDIDTSRKTKGIIDSFTHFLEKGNMKLEYDNIQYKIMKGEASENDIKRAENLKQMMDADKKQAPSFLDNPAVAMAGAVAQSLPEMMQGISQGVKDTLPTVALAVAATVATGGSDLVALGAAATAAGLREAFLKALGTKGVQTAASWAFRYGMWEGMAKPETGARFAEYGEMKDKQGNPLFTDDERRLWAALGGGANAGIEMMDFGLVTKALKPTPHAAKVFDDIIKNTAAKSEREMITDMVKGRGADWLKLTSAESGEEALQSASDDLIHNAQISGKDTNEKTYSPKEIAGRAIASFVESLPGSMGFAAVGAGGGMATRTGAMVRNFQRETRVAQQYGENAVHTMNGTIMVEQLQQAVASGKLKETAPDVQQKILREQLKDTGYETAYIDVETALQKETGVEDLKKVADKAGMSREDLQTAIEEKGFISVPVEVLSQVESSPDLLDSISFKENAESMARMRMNQKELRESYQAALKQVLENKAKNIDNIIAQAIPNATKEQKEMLEEIIMTNLDNPAQGFKAVRTATQQELDEILAPALKALEAGAGKAHTLTIKDEQGNEKTIYTPGENEPWYRNFYAQFGHYPTKAEFRDMAIALVTGDPSAPKVMNWTVDSLEQQQAMENNKGIIDRLQARLKTLQAVKPEVEKLTGVEMQLTEGLTPEGFKMYRQLFDWLRNVGGATARQARMGAILAARHADIYAAKVTERTGKKYTALDYMHDKIGFSVRRADAGLNQQGTEIYEITGDEDIEFEPDDNYSYRFTNSKNDGPMSRAGYAMFADNIEDIAYSYGRQAYRVKKDNLEPGEKVQELVKKYIKDVKEKEESEGILDDNEIINDFRNDEGEIDLDKVDDVINELNPDDIVNSAEWYDNESAVSWLWENILEPNNIWGIKTEDGAIVFDEDIIEPDFKASVYYGNVGDEIKVPEEPLETLMQRVWHGSPYDFETFDLGAIGTGEGAQAHGWGLYFAGNREVSERYKEFLSEGRTLFDGKVIPDVNSDEFKNLPNAERRALLAVINHDGNVEAAKVQYKEMAEAAAEGVYGNKTVETEIQKAFEILQSGRIKTNKGKLFEVEIPDNDVLLDEQKPLNQQPEKVKEAIINILAEKSYNESLENNQQLNKEEIETLETLQKMIIKNDDVDKIEDAIFSSGTISEESTKIFELLREGKRSQGLLLTKQIIAKLTNEKSKGREKVEEIKGSIYQKYSNVNGENIYDEIANSPREASEKLNAAGVKGITYEGGRDGRCFVIFDDKAIDIIEKYNQQVRQNQVKGQTSLLDNGKRLVSILESADESTFMHEMAHVFLYDLQDLAQIDDVSAKELEIVNEWANWQKGAAAEYKSTPWAREFAQLEQEIIDAEAHGDFDLAEQKKRQWRQERFARGFELYLKDGQAPAKGLKAVFRKFKQFLRQIYAAFTSDGGKPTLPVKRVMDRMIASEQEIEAMELDDRFTDVEKAGGEKLLDEKEEDTYRRFYQESEDEAKEQLLKIVMKDLEKEKQAEFDYEVAKERDRKEKELQQEPIYMAEKAAMTSGSDSIVENWYPSIEAFREELANTPPLEEALQDHMDRFTNELDARLIESHLSEEAVEKAMKMSKYRTKMESLKGKAMAKKLALVKKINAKAEKAMDSIEEKLAALPEDTDLKVDKDTDGVKSVVREISKLKFAAKWNKDELAHIESMIRASTQDEVRQAINQLKENNARNKIREEEILKATEGRQAIFRDMAKAAMAEKPISESCNVGYYRSQEKKAARRVRDMLRAKRYDMALKAQEQQANFAALAELAEANKEERDKLLAQVHRELNARTVKLPKDERYWHRQLAYILRISKNEPNIPENGVRPLHELIKGMEDSLDILQGALDEMLRIATQGERYQGYQTMTMDEFKDAVQSLHTIYVVGRDKFKMKTMQGKNLLDVVDECITEDDTIASNIDVDRRMVNADKGGLAYSELIGNTGDIGHLIAKRGQDYIASNLKPENILSMIGQKAHDYIYGTLERAAEAEAKMQADNIQKLQEIMSVYSHKERQDWSKKIYDFSTEKGDKISKEQIMCMALNWGNMSNRQRLLGGLASDERTPEAVARMTKEVMDLFQETMTAKDWQVVQKIWDHIGSYWEDTVKVEEKLNGVTLERIEPTPFTITSSDGQEMDLAGGYVPVKYDSEKSSRAGEQAENAEVQSMLAGAQRFGVGRSFTKGRSEFDIYRPLVLDFSVVEEHLQNVIHNATYRLPVRDVYRLVTNLDFENHVVEHLGREYHNILKAWAVDAWKPPMLDNNTADNVLSNGLGMLRRSATLSIMGYRLWPVIENVSNIAVAAEKIGSAEMAAAIGDFYSNPGGNMKSVKQKSLFMRNRIDNMDRDIRNQPGIFHAGNRLAEFAVSHAYDLMVYSDLACSAPLWMRAYKNAYEPMLDKVKAENEANIQYLIECQQKVDEIKAQIIDLTTEAGQMDEHLKARRYASPETAEALRQSPFAMHTDNDLRALAGENRKKAKQLEKERWQAEAAFQEAQEIKILSDDEILDEAEHRAIFAADGVIRDTFGSGRNIDLPAVQRSRNEITKLLTVFYGFFNTQFNAVYMQYARSQHLPANNVIEKWMPFARTIMFRIVLTSLIGSCLQFGLGLAGGDDDDKKRKVKGPDGKTTEVDVPVLERFLKVFGKNTISTSVGSMYLVRDVIGVISDFVINDKTYGLNTGSVASRGVSEIGKMVVLLSTKGQRDADIQAQQEKKEKEHQEKLAKYKGKKRQEYLKKWEEEQKYVKPPKRITYAEIAGHGLKGISSLTAAQTGITSTMVNAVTSTMQYMLDTDMRYDPSWKNIIWSALFDKKPVEREIPKKPPAESKKNKKKKKEKN